MGAHISIFPMVHKHRISQDGKVALVLRIDLNGKPVAYDKIGERTYKIPIQHWDDKNRCVASANPLAKLLNTLINKRKLQFEAAILKRELLGHTINKANLKLIVEGKEPGQCFFSFCEKQVKEKYKNPRTKAQYTGELSKLKKYKEAVSFSDVDYLFLQGYESYMRDDLKNQSNTVWKSFKFLNTMMNDAVKIGGIIDMNPFSNYDRGRFRQTTRTYLNSQERESIAKLLLKPEVSDVQKSIAAYFLFMCYCGLRYEDAISFDYNYHIIDDERIVFKTQKAGTTINIKLYPKLRELILYIQNSPIKLTNQRFNLYLKMIGPLAGINKVLTAHVGRIHLAVYWLKLIIAKG